MSTAAGAGGAPAAPLGRSSGRVLGRAQRAPQHRRAGALGGCEPRVAAAQLFSYQGRITRVIGVRRRRAGQFIVLEAEQTQAFDDTPELQELECHANLYGLQRENGWFVYDGQLEHELEHPAAEPHHSAAADERDQKLMEAMVLCPPKSL